MIWWSELKIFLLGEVSFRKLPDTTDSDNVQVDLFPVDLPKSTNQSHLPNSIFRIPDFWVTSNPKFRLLDSDEILFDCRLLMKFHLFWSQNRTKNRQFIREPDHSYQTIFSRHIKLTLWKKADISIWNANIKY